MPLDRAVGDSFPDFVLHTERGETTSISELAQGRPLFLAFFRGRGDPSVSFS